MADRDVEIKVKVDAQGAVQTFDALGNKIQAVDGSAARAAAGGFSKFQASIVALQSSIQLAQTAISAVGSVIGTVFDGLSKGSAVDDVEVGFKRLTEAAGGVSSELINNLQAATAGTVSDLDLMKGAISGLRANMKPDEIELVTKAARALAEESGGNFKDTFDGLVDSLQKGSDRFLKSQGILIDNKKAYEDFAKTIGTTGDALNEQGKAAAITAASMLALQSKVESVGNISLDAGDRIDILKTNLKNATDQAWKNVASDIGVNNALDDLAATIKTVDFTGLITGLTKLLTLSIKIIGPLNSIGTWVGDLAQKLAASSISPKLNKIKESLSQVVEKLGKDTPKATKEAIVQWDKLTKVFNEGDFVMKNALVKDFEKVNEQVNLSAKAHGLLSTEAAGVVGIIKPSIPVVKDYATGFIDTTIAAKNLAEAEKKVAEEAAKLPGVMVEVSNAFKGGVFEGKISDLFGDGISKSVGDSSQGVFADIGAAMASSLVNSFSSVIDAAFSGKTLKSGDYSGMLGDLAGSISDAFLPGSGPIANSLVKGLAGLFSGKDSAGTTARKSADKFFADAFEANRLAVIINGQLAEVKDLVFKGDTLFGGSSDFASGSFTHFFDTLEPAARTAFAGVGAGFEELLGVSGDISGQIGAVLANNIGGSLNNLQLLVESSGMSFEQLHDGVVAAFMDGKLSALEATSALQGLAQVAQKGIPDGLGRTAEAFDHIKEAGVKGGRTLVDALQDVGYEAKELDIKTFPALIKNLEASGKFTSNEIALVFDALKAHGIDSVEKLTSATTEQLIPVLGQLETTKFPFKEAAADMRELITQVNELPSVIEKKVIFNVQVNADSAGKAVLDQVGINSKTGVGLTNRTN